jgi:hypothetical protein
MVLNVPQTVSGGECRGCLLRRKRKAVAVHRHGFEPQKLDSGGRNVNGEEKARACLMFAGNGLE